MGKLIGGICSAVLGLAAGITSIAMVVTNIPAGPLRSIYQYRQPFPGHAVLAVGLLAAGGLLLLGGIIFTVLGATERR